MTKFDFNEVMHNTWSVKSLEVTRGQFLSTYTVHKMSAYFQYIQISFFFLTDSFG